MSQQRISRNPDLSRLQDEGYDIRIVHNHLVMRGVPYVNAAREVKRGILVSELTMAGDLTQRPSTHVMHFAGEYPCDRTGCPIEKIRHQSNRKVLGPDLVIDHSFSSRPPAGYADYHEKMSTYAAIIASPAAAIDPSAVAQVFPVVLPDREEDSVFRYLDTASSRAGITAVTAKLAIPKIAIIGVGGSGSYILDLTAKTPVGEIHLFDGDRFLQHNAFRSPGAPCREELANAPNKAEWFAGRYAPMRRGIIAHPHYIDATNIDELSDMNYVFLALDKGTPKRAIIERLETWNIPFIDVGIGVNQVNEALHGVLRVTTSTPTMRDHVWTNQRIPFSDGDGNNEYDQNIQIADLNALNAALAVVKWKKLCGFYADLEHEHFSTYTTDGDLLTNEDQG